MRITENKRVAFQNHPHKRQRITKKTKEELDQEIDALIEKILQKKTGLDNQAHLLCGWLALKGKVIPRELASINPPRNVSKIEEGDTLLHIAVKLKNLKLLKLLLKLEMDPHAANSANKTVFETALRCLKSSRYKGSYLKALCETPVRLEELRFSRPEERIDFFENYSFYLTGKIEINAKNNEGNTFLHEYFNLGIPRLVRKSTVLHFERFKAFNPDLTIRNNEGLTCYQVAAIQGDRFNFSQMMEYMKQTGQDVKEPTGNETEKEKEAFKKMNAWRFSDGNWLTDYIPCFDLQKILSYLTLSELFNFAHVSWDAYTLSNQEFINRARELGSLANNANEAKVYLRTLFEEINLCFELLPGHIDPKNKEQTLLNLKTLNSDELLKLFCEDTFHARQHLPNYLKRNHIKTEFQTEVGNKALLKACKWNHIKNIEFILSLGVCPKSETEGRTIHPLYFAAESGSLESVVMLFESYPNKKFTQNQLNYALLYACGYKDNGHYKSNPQIVKFLINEGAQIDFQSEDTDETALECAIRANKSRIIKVLTTNNQQ